jgi:hypothetical protein
MRRTEVLQGLRTMKFEEVYDRFRHGRLEFVERIVSLYRDRYAGWSSPCICPRDCVDTQKFTTYNVLLTRHK